MYRLDACCASRLNHNCLLPELCAFIRRDLFGSTIVIVEFLPKNKKKKLHFCFSCSRNDWGLYARTINIFLKLNEKGGNFSA
jgi:hypothetical protein